MWFFTKKKKLELPKNNGNNSNSGEDIDAPDVDDAIDKIDAALKLAEKEKHDEAQREENERLASKERESRRGGCWC